jgi:hypothetical protein
MAVFKKRNLELVLARKKTQTRRTHKQEWKIGHVYSARASWFEKAAAWILIMRKFKQRLGDISEEDVEKEGFKTLSEFREEWRKNYGSWEPNILVIVYEFKLCPLESRIGCLESLQ